MILFTILLSITPLLDTTVPNDRIKDFLNSIRQIESSGGQDTDHPAMTAGLQAGTQAYGQYGLMPNTVKEMATRNVRHGDLDPDMAALKNMPTENINDFLSHNPDTEEGIANDLANKVLSQQAGDEEKAAYSWNMGHNLTPEQISQRGYLDHPYVKKFDMIRNMIKPSGNN